MEPPPASSSASAPSGSFPIEIDEDVRREYWTDIRGLPDRVDERVTYG